MVAARLLKGPPTRFQRSANEKLSPPGDHIMSCANYLRRQATHCLSLARTCFDLGTARELRLMAGEMMKKAQELEGADLTEHQMTKAGESSNADHD